MNVLEELQEKYESGKFDGLKTDLESFIVSHRDEIRSLSENSRFGRDEHISFELAIKMYIMKHRTINPRRDITDQVDEIQREKWIIGVKNGKPPDPQDVARQWAKDHSQGWRDHRVLSIIYVFERDKERYLGLLR